MYKVLIVDDEPIIRLGLKNIIQWEEYGCQVCAEASDGDEGLEKIVQYRPDIVFTDIRMPEMDGLEMISKIAKHDEDMKIIVLTGFRDFEYVKEALTLGAFDYLLKPTKLDEIAKVINKAVKALNEVHERERKLNLYKKKYERGLVALKQKFLYDVMTGIISNKQEIVLQKKSLNVNIDNVYMVFIKSLNVLGKEIQNGMVDTFKDVLNSRYELTNISIDRETSVVLIHKADEISIHEVIKSCFDSQKMFQQQLGIDIYFSVSPIITNIDNINENYKSLLVGNSKNEQVIQSLSNKNIVIRDNVIEDKNLKEIKTLIIGGLSSSSKIMITHSINTLKSNFKNKTLSDAQKQMIEDIKTYIYENLLEDHEQIINDTNEEDALSCIYSLSEKLIDQLPTKNKMRIVMKKSIEYLEQNYNHQITLQELADKVYVSQYHLSRMFKKETGKTMTEYLNEIRVEKACLLMQDMQYKIYQIGDLVGISDAHYFSRIFKKIIGVTPTEYRNQITNIGN